ncbi:MAG: hypothetical protein JXB08_00075 [Bacilli bacterium]|nr:hypothetical protein [Bacilli bacterium]MBN2876542.1 hypothetical protein [Bacilli bacterium]
MKITFVRKKSLYGFAVKMKIWINGEVVYKLKNGETYVYKSEQVKSIRVGSHALIKSLDIPFVNAQEELEIKLNFNLGLIMSGITAVVSANQTILGVYQDRI